MSSVEAVPLGAQSAGADDLAATMASLGEDARRASRTLSRATTQQKNAALKAMAQAIRDRAPDILRANRLDLEAAAASGLGPALTDRLRLDEKRLAGIALGVDDIAALEDPVGTTIRAWERPNGLHIARVRVPLGVIGIIYESRPNVTADAGALCLKSGNAVILRGGKESFHSSTAIHAALVDGLLAADLPAAAISLVPVKDRAAVGLMLTDMNQFIDVIIPRGGRSLIERVQADARLPVMGHLDGLCHIYVDREADLEMAISVVINSKLRRTGICGASETLLIDKAAPTGTTVALVEALQAAGCEVRGDEAVCAINREVVPAKPDDWTTEYLDAIISVRMVDGVAGAAEHIEAFGSQHTDSIITDNEETAAWFLDAIDSAIVMHNASTQFADGGEFGMGAEIGIATGKLHARGPVGAEQLTSFKYIVRGRGSIRP